MGATLGRLSLRQPLKHETITKARNHHCESRPNADGPRQYQTTRCTREHVDHDGRWIVYLPLARRGGADNPNGSATGLCASSKMRREMVRTPRTVRHRFRHRKGICRPRLQSCCNFAQHHPVEGTPFVAQLELGGWRYRGSHYCRKSSANSYQHIPLDRRPRQQRGDIPHQALYRLYGR
jgi:hypothetical protein